jgi:hypothetical protein
MCSIHLARYEDALASAGEVRGAALTLNDYTYLAKAYEIEGLANYFLAKGDVAEEGVRRGLSDLSKHGYTVVKPRLEWLLATLHRRKGEVEESGRQLREAGATLLEPRDPQHLWGSRSKCTSASLETATPALASSKSGRCSKRPSRKAFCHNGAAACPPRSHECARSH